LTKNKRQKSTVAAFFSRWKNKGNFCEVCSATLEFRE
jgi:hypothetical protein